MSKRFLSHFRSRKCLFLAVAVSVIGTFLVATRQTKLTQGYETEPLRKALEFDTTQSQNDIETTDAKEETPVSTHLVKFLPSDKKTEVAPVTSPASFVQSQGNFQNVQFSANRGSVVSNQPGPLYYPPQQYETRAPYGAPQYSSAAAHQPPFVPQRRLVHFDLKGAPPKISYLEKLFPVISQLGANAVLLEYEDMFPYEGPLAPVTASNHYTKQEVQKLVALARAYNFEVIPLVQTFGHLEYVLKLEQFAHLRENPDEAQAVCPSRNESVSLVEMLVDQVIKMHPGIKYVHIGCDEVFQFGKCSLCSVRNREDLFLGHVTTVANYIRRKYGITPIIWDDMLRSFSLASLQQSGLGSLVEPMVWVYAEDVYHFVQMQTFTTYSQVFPAFWASSAFKGAFGETLVVPNVKRHLENNQNWLIAARDEGAKFKEGFRGLVLAGWQRYDHFATLCELLPAGVPSLATNLLATSRGYLDDSLAPLLYKVLNCTQSPRDTRLADLQHDPFLHQTMAFCSFPGMDFFRLTSRFLRLEKEIENVVQRTSRSRGWLTDYNIRHNYSSGSRVDELTRDLGYLPRALQELARQIILALAPIYDTYTVSEWMEQKLLPLFEKLDRIRIAGTMLKAVKTWKPRPLPIYSNWNYYGIDLNRTYEESLKPQSVPQ